jgi:CheY-like chemotaxis protein
MSANIESDAALQSALKDLIQLAGLPESTSINAQGVQEAVHKLRGRLKAVPETSAASAAGGAHQSALIIGPLGLILHQVKHLLTPHCPQIAMAKNMEEALIGYQQNQPSLIVLDVLMPTSREGLGLIQAIRQLAQKSNQPPPQVIILSTLNQEDQLLENCQKQGLKHVLDRQDGWQQNILDILSRKTA